MFSWADIFNVRVLTLNKKLYNIKNIHAINYRVVQIKVYDRPVT